MTLSGASFDINALGRRVRIAFEDGVSEQLVERARVAWSGALLDGVAEPDVTVVVPAVPNHEYLLGRLSVDVTFAALEENRGEMMMFHAAGIAADDGRVLVFIGPSGRGKTTLSRTLAREFGYVSDEAVAVDAEGRVHAYRKPLSIIRAGQPKDQVAPSSLGLRDLPDTTLHLAGLVVLDRREGCSAATIERLSLADAVESIVGQLSFWPEMERPLQRLASLAETTGGVIRLTYTEASTVLPAVRAAFDGQLPPIEDVAFGPALPQLGQFAGQSIAPGAVADAIDDGDAVIVLMQRTIRVLSGIAPEIWRGVVAGLDRDRIVEAVVDRYGTPPSGNAEMLVDAAVEALIVAGVVVGDDGGDELDSGASAIGLRTEESTRS